QRAANSVQEFRQAHTCSDGLEDLLLPSQQKPDAVASPQTPKAPTRQVSPAGTIFTHWPPFLSRRTNRGPCLRPFAHSLAPWLSSHTTPYPRRREGFRLCRHLLDNWRRRCLRK